MDRQGQGTMSNLPSNVYIQYAPAGTGNGGDKSYYKLENIPFQSTINLNQPISIINGQGCIINQQNNGQGFQTAVINNQCAPTNYVTLSPGNWNGMQQVQSDDQMIYQIMYPIMDGTTLDGQHLTAKQTTVDANLLTAGTCTVLAPAKTMSSSSVKKEQYELVNKHSQYTSTEEIVTIDVSHQHMQHYETQDDGKKKAKKSKDDEDENTVYACSFCNVTYRSKGQLRFHLTTHNPKSRNKYVCIGCTEGFEKEKMKQEHELTCGKNLKMARFECCFCDQPFNTPKGLRKHENRHRPKRTTKRYRHTCVCIECNKAFDAIYSLKVHIQKFHKKNFVKPLDDKPFTCSECGQGFKYERSKLKHEFKAHMKQEAATL